MAIPFPIGSLPYEEVFAPATPKGRASKLGDALREGGKPRRKSYTLWLLTKVIQCLATMAAMILLIKAGEFMIIVAHLW